MRLKHIKMQSIRQIVEVKNHSLNIVLPNDFHANQVEVIILSVDEQPLKINNVFKPLVQNL